MFCCTFLSKPCGEIQIIKEDLPLRTPKETVGRLTPLNIFRSGVHIQIPPINRSQADQYGFGNENDSDAMSEESFESELSPSERRLHQSALVSCDMLDDSTSSDDENIEQQFRVQPGRSALDRFRRSFGTEKNQEADGARLAVAKRSMPTHNTWKKHSLNQFREVPRAFWPSWVYQMYDSYSLAQKAAGHVVFTFSFLKIKDDKCSGFGYTSLDSIIACSYDIELLVKRSFFYSS